jgi:hypothetical protein
MFKNIILNTFAVATVILPGISFAGGPLDNGVDECGVPVCDITATVNALSALNENQRFNYTTNLKTTFSKSKDVSILENLYEVSGEIKKLTIRSNDADWVVREPTNLANSVVINLAKYSAVKSSTISKYFKMLTSGDERNKVIYFWSTFVDSNENISKLIELSDFAQQAKVISIEAGDESWISRNAEALVSKITIKLTQLDPAHEGLFDVRITNELTVPGILPFDKISVLDSSTSSNLVVVFYNSKFKRKSFEFSNAAISGSTITGQIVSNMTTSKKFKITLDRNTGLMYGNIESTDSTIEFVGRQAFSTRSVFKGEVPYALTANDAIGSFDGKLGSLEGTLTVKSFKPGIYSATFRTKSGAVKVDFLGKFFPKNGVLSLTNKNDMKLIVSLRKVGEDVKWNGFTFNSKNPSYKTATFSVK